MFLAVFCLRLAAGLVAALLLLPASRLNPRFFRAQFLTALGLLAAAAFLAREAAGPWLWAALAAGLVLCFLGSVVWMLEGAPGGRALAVLAVPPLAAALLLTAR